MIGVGLGIANKTKKGFIYLLKKLGIDTAFAVAPWQISGDNAELFQVRRSTDGANDIILAHNGVLDPENSVMKNSGETLRQWSFDYTATLYVIDWVFPDGNNATQATASAQPVLDPINKGVEFDGSDDELDLQSNFLSTVENNFAIIASFRIISSGRFSSVYGHANTNGERLLLDNNDSNR